MFRALLLDKTDDASMYDQLADDVVEAFGREFVTAAGRVMGDTVFAAGAEGMCLRCSGAALAIRLK